MLIQVKKESIETVELKTPGYYKDNYAFHFINEEGVIVSVRNVMISLQTPGTTFYQRDLGELVQMEASTDEEFATAYAKAIQQISLQYKVPV